jgi:hypothetical protein
MMLLAGRRPSAIRVFRQSFHVTTPREIAPLVVGLGLLVFANVASYALRSLDAKDTTSNGQQNLKEDKSMQQPLSSNDVSQSKDGKSHPLWTSGADSLGVDIGSGSMRISAMANNNDSTLPEVSFVLNHQPIYCFDNASKHSC